VIEALGGALPSELVMLANSAGCFSFQFRQQETPVKWALLEKPRKQSTSFYGMRDRKAVNI
jgi:hypothetical protein